MAPQTAQQGSIHERPYELLTQKNQLDSPLLRLPAELRNRMYEFAFAGQSITVLRERKEPYAPEIQGAIAVLFTCRQIDHEMASLFWSHTPFDLNLFNELTDSPSKSLTSLGDKRCSLIQSIKIHGTIAAHVYPYMNFGGKTCLGSIAEGTAGLPSIQHVDILVHRLLVERD